MYKAAFIDRDGVINDDVGYVYHCDDFVFLPGVVAALQATQSLGYKLVVITNQAGIGRGFYSEDDYRILTDHMKEILRVEGINLDGVYHCPHHPEHGIGRYKKECDCRKPRPGMILRARDDLNIDLASSVLFGDKLSDIEAGHAAGIGFNILIRSEYVISESVTSRPDHVCDSLFDGVRFLSEKGFNRNTNH